jgi:hypothetical protein
MRLLSLSLILFGLVVPASAETISSQYTEYNIDKCKKTFGTPGDEDSIYFICPGYKSNQVYFAEGDLRTLIAYGKNPSTHCSGQQTFGGFNTATPTIEWRLRDGKPFAAIQRWNVSDFDDSSKIKSWLGVTKLEGINSCRVAIVEGSLKNANIRARQAADTLVADFNCAVDEAKVISTKPMTAGELMSGTPCANKE